MNKITFADRLISRRNELNITQDELARMANVSRMGISKIELGLTQHARSDTLFAIADALKCSARWLLSGEDEVNAVNQQKDSKVIENKMLLVPLLSWEQLNSDVEAQELKPCPEPCGSNSFAVTVEGDAMMPKFENGDLIFIDSDLIKPENEKFFIVYRGKTDSYNLKQIKMIDGLLFLHSLNPTYPQEIRYSTMDVTDKIIGKVIGHQKPVI